MSSGDRVFLKKDFKKGLTLYKSSVIIYEQLGRPVGLDAGMAELADARDLKSREIYFSYRFDPGFRHHISRSGAVWSARRAHNPKVVRFKSHLRNHIVHP